MLGSVAAELGQRLAFPDPSALYKSICSFSQKTKQLLFPVYFVDAVPEIAIIRCNFLQPGALLQNKNKTIFNCIETHCMKGICEAKLKT